MEIFNLFVSLVKLVLDKVKSYPPFYLPCPILHTVSKAFLKSTKSQHSFLPEEKYKEISECITKRQSCTEYPFPNPPCTESCVKNGDLQSICFPCKTSVRQGEKLPPFLFALYLSDLEVYLSENYVNHLEFLNENCIQHIVMYFKLFLLLYA
jgi:hypothetical protein